MRMLNKTESGNKFIVVAIVYITKYVEIQALPNKSAQSTSNFIFKRIICNHGCPNVMLLDNRREF